MSKEKGSPFKWLHYKRRMGKGKRLQEQEVPRRDGGAKGKDSKNRKSLGETEG